MSCPRSSQRALTALTKEAPQVPCLLAPVKTREKMPPMNQDAGPLQIGLCGAPDSDFQPPRP